MNRRNFIENTSALGVGLTIVSAKTAFGYDANSKIRLANIGCGGRGTFVGDIFKEHGKYEFVAAGDYFEDKLNAYSERFGIPADKRFTGLDSLKKILSSTEVDAVAVHSPPYFHPEQTELALEAGKHVFMAKPVAVDVPGSMKVSALGKRATEKKLAFAIDFQSRGSALFQEAVKRVQDGALGEITFGECVYEFDTLSPVVPPDGSKEAMLRNWVFEKALSGDIITEQNIHALDVLSWVLGNPVAATGFSGRKVRTNVGDTSDHYSVLYHFPNDVGIQFHSRQYSAWGAPGQIANRIFGTKGVLFTEFFGRVMIRGGKDNAWSGGQEKNLYKEGSVNNVREFHQNIVEGKFENPSIEPSVRSNLLCLLGKAAAEAKQTVTLEEMVKASKKVEVDLTGLKA